MTGPEEKLGVTLDIDLYKRAKKLEYLQSKFKDKWVLCPCAFHTVICALRCLGRAPEGSGLDESWQKADLYSKVTVMQIVNGGHYNRELQAHQITLQLLFDLWMESFFKAHPAIRIAVQESVAKLAQPCTNCQDVHKAHKTFLMELKCLNFDKLLEEFDDCLNNQAVY